MLVNQASSNGNADKARRVLIGGEYVCDQQLMGRPQGLPQRAAAGIPGQVHECLLAAIANDHTLSYLTVLRQKS